jgi:2-methylcitrate dehydratase PrpD
VATPSVDPTGAIARYVTGLSLADVPTSAVDQALLAIADTIGVALAGSRSTAGAHLADYVCAFAGSGPATVIGSTLHVAAESAALANGTMAHALDYDDRGHASTHVLATALALGEQQRSSGETLLLAYIAGRELRLALDDALDKHRYEGRGAGARGWHATGVFGALGSTAAAGVVLGLDAPTLAVAFGIAGSLASGLMANFGTMTKALHAGNAARNGVLAASLARAGFSADPAILSVPKGLVEAVSDVVGGERADAVAADLGSGFRLAREGVRIKPYPSCTGAHPYLDAVLRVRAERNLSAESVAYVECTSTGGLNRRVPTTPLECKFSAGYAVAVALVAGTFDESHCSMEFRNRPDVRRLLDRTTYLGELWADKRSSRLVLGLTSGERIEVAVSSASDLTEPADVLAKFFANATPVVGRGQAERIVSTVTSLAQRPVAELTAALSAERPR